MDLLQKIYDATNGGLDIILHYYPQAADSVDKPIIDRVARDMFGRMVFGKEGGGE